LNIPVVSCSFVLYSDNIDGTKEYEKVNGEYIKLDEPIKLKMFGVYRHSFGCSLKDAVKQWSCVKQILSFNRFYHSIGRELWVVVNLRIVVSRVEKYKRNI